MDLLTIFNILKQRLWVILAFPLIAVIVAAFLVSQMEDVFLSTAQLATGFTSDETVTLSEEKNSNQFEVTTKFSNTIESMASIPVMSLVSYRLMLHDLETARPFRKLKNDVELDFALTPEFIDKAKAIYKERLSQFSALNTASLADEQALVLLKQYEYDYQSLLENFRINRQKTSDFINVDFYSENPMLSAFAVNALAEEFIRFNKALKTDRSSVSIEILEKTLEDKRKVRDDRTKALSDFKVANNLFNYNAESESKISQISDYEVAKDLEQKKISALEFSLRNVEGKIGVFKKADKEEITRVNQRIIELQRKINEISSATDEASRTRVAKLRDELQLEMSRVDQLNDTNNAEELKTLADEKNKIELDLQISRSNLQSIDETLRRARYSVSDFATKEAKLADLTRDLQTAIDEYEGALDKYNSAMNKASAIGTQLRQIYTGQPASEPEPSKGWLLIGLAGIGSFVLCALVLIGVELANLSIRTQTRLENQTKIRSIGVLNDVDNAPVDLQRVFASKSKEGKLDVLAHFLRKFRFEVQNSSARVLLVTSTKAQVGKTFVIIALSYTLSLLNKRILIIDTNFKNNALTRLLVNDIEYMKKLKEDPNSSIPFLLAEKTLLENGSADEQDNGYVNGREPNFTHESAEQDTTTQSKNGVANTKNKTIIHKTKYQKVDIIGNFGGRDSPSEILAGKNFSQMIENLTLEYDHIIMEGPSLNEYSDTKELVEFADKVLTVFDAHSTLNNLDRDSIKYLKTLKPKLIGSLLNKVDLKDLSV
jgi:succinoglycan biosynthesis transport protein ExoP